MSASTSTTLAIVIAGGAMLATGWFGGSMYISRSAEDNLKSFASDFSSHNNLRLLNLDHKPGIFSSSGTFEFHLMDQGKDIPVAKVEYALAHAILPTSLMRVAWTAKPLGEIYNVLGNQLSWQGSGEVTWGGWFRSSVAMPELSFVDQGDLINVTPVSGAFASGDDALSLRLDVGKIAMRGHGKAMELNRLSFRSDLKNRFLGTGTTSMSIDGISTGFGFLEGLRLAVSAVQNGQNIDTNITGTLGSGNFGGQTVKDISVEMAVNGLNARSIETINRIIKDKGDLRNLSTGEDSRMREALRTQLIQGFSVGIPKLVGLIGDTGSVNGNLSIDLRRSASPTAPIALSKLVRAKGELNLIGMGLNQDVGRVIAALGIAQQENGTLKASFEYDDGMLHANGRVFDAENVESFLRATEVQVNATLDKPLSESLLRLAGPATNHPLPEAASNAKPEVYEGKPSIAPAETQPAPSLKPSTPAMPAPAPVSAECLEARQCLAQSLMAAANEDMETVRTLAARFDSLAKPAPGNRTVSRKLNEQGLDAMKHDDPAGAAGFFRTALNENPRDVEVAANLGFALVESGNPENAIHVLTQALLLDPRRTATWTPLAEALVMEGRKEEALAALWVGFQWSSNREKSMIFYANRAKNKGETHPEISEMYGNMNAWLTGGARPDFGGLARR